MADKTKVDKQRAEIKQETDVKERQKALDSALQKIKKNFGDGAVMRMGENKATSVEAVPSGILSLDLALGIGGFPRGRIIEMYGPESSGKSTVAMQAVAEVQKRGGTAAYIDAENAMDPVYAGHLGVNIDDLYLSQPDTGEQGLEIADAHVGLQARLMSQALRKLSGAVNKTKTIVIFINQIREKVGVMFGNPEVTPGGRALKFYASVRLEVRRGELIKDGGKDKAPLGNQVKIKVAKNKMAPPFKVAEVTNYYGRGISYVADVLDNAVEQGIAGKSGSWFDFEGEKLGQGRNNAIQTLENNPEKFGRLNTLLCDKLFNTPEDPETEPVDKQAAKGKTDKAVKAVKAVKAPKAQVPETPKKSDEHYGTERLDLGSAFLTETPNENYSPGKADE